MVSHLVIVRAGLLCAGVLAGPALRAQTAPASPPPAPPAGAQAAVLEAVLDPAAPVPAPSYRSVFGRAPTGVEEREVDWRRANEDVGQFRRGHADILRWESQHGEGH